MDEYVPSPVGKRKGRPRKNDSEKEEACPSKKQRGRPRKKPIIESLDVLDCENQFAQSHGQFPENSSQLVTIAGLSMNDHEHTVQEAGNRKEKGFSPDMAACNTTIIAKAKKPRGRPKKKRVTESPDGLDCQNQLVQPLAVQFPENSCKSSATNGLSTSSHGNSVQERANKQEKGFNQVMAACNSARKTPMERRRSKRKTQVVSYGDAISLPLSTPNMDKESSHANFHTNINSGEDPTMSNDDLHQNDSTRKTPTERRRSKRNTHLVSYSDEISLPLSTQNMDQESSRKNFYSYINSGEDPMMSNDDKNDSYGVSSANGSIPDDIALPRIMLCLAHNGKVAWDVKWRPSSLHDLECKHRMGYLAVLLGNGSLEV